MLAPNPGFLLLWAFVGLCQGHFAASGEAQPSCQATLPSCWASGSFQGKRGNLSWLLVSCAWEFNISSPARLPHLLQKSAHVHYQPTRLSSAERARDLSSHKLRCMCVCVCGGALPAQVADKRIMTEDAHSFLFFRTRLLGEKGKFA